jgi:hypothetical protein
MFERGRTRSRNALVAAAFCVLWLGSPAGAKPTLTSFDPPGSVQTNTTAINETGTVTGYYSDGTQYRGFLRRIDGTIDTFAPSGSIAAYVMAINADDTVTGFYIDTGNDIHSFIRTADGTITTFDVSGNWTSATAINDKGVTAGYYSESADDHGFVRSARGKLTSFDIAGEGRGGGPSPNGINAAGTVAGTWLDTGNAQHGFVRTADGTTTAFDPPGSFQTQVAGINASGAIAGYFNDDAGGHGYIRAPDGGFTIIDVPGYSFASAFGLDRRGMATGYCAASDSVAVGFIYRPNGKVATFRMTGAGTERYQGTYPVGINDSDMVAGYYLDGGNVMHGFIRTR